MRRRPPDAQYWVFTLVTIDPGMFLRIEGEVKRFVGVEMVTSIPREKISQIRYWNRGDVSDDWPSDERPDREEREGLRSSTTAVNAYREQLP